MTASVLVNLAAGTTMIVVTVFVHAAGLLTLSWLLRGTMARFRFHHHQFGTMGIMVATVLGLFAIHTVEIWAWAIAYLLLGAVPNLEDALFFSFLSFSTLGAEPVSVTDEWQLFGSVEGVNGFLLIGWSTAYLIPAWTKHGPFHEDRHF